LVRTWKANKPARDTYRAHVAYIVIVVGRTHMQISNVGPLLVASAYVSMGQ